MHCNIISLFSLFIYLFILQLLTGPLRNLRSPTNVVKELRFFLKHTDRKQSNQFHENVLTRYVNFAYNILLNVQMLGITWKRDHSFALTYSQVKKTLVNPEYLLKWVVWIQMLCLKVCKSLMINVFNPLVTCGNKRLYSFKETSAASSYRFV